MEHAMNEWGQQVREITSTALKFLHKARRKQDEVFRANLIVIKHRIRVSLRLSCNDSVTDIKRIHCPPFFS